MSVSAPPVAAPILCFFVRVGLKIPTFTDLFGAQLFAVCGGAVRNGRVFCADKYGPPELSFSTHWLIVVEVSDSPGSCVKKRAGPDTWHRVTPSIGACPEAAAEPGSVVADSQCSKSIAVSRSRSTPSRRSSAVRGTNTSGLIPIPWKRLPSGLRTSMPVNVKPNPPGS